MIISQKDIENVMRPPKRKAGRRGTTVHHKGKITLLLDDQTIGLLFLMARSFGLGAGRVRGISNFINGIAHQLPSLRSQLRLGLYKTRTGVSKVRAKGRFTESQIIAIRNSPDKCEVLAMEYGVSKMFISLVRRGKRYGWVSEK